MDKFTKAEITSDWEILTPDGFVDVNVVLETIPFDMFSVETESGKTITVADTHIFIDADGIPVFAIDLDTNTYLQTESGIEKVTSVTALHEQQTCYDVYVNSPEHTYLTNGIVSHNTTVATAYLLHQALFKPDSTIAILGNKESTAKEILDRIKFAFSELPWYMKPGVWEWNKKSIHLSLGAKGVKVFISACSMDSIRGKSVSSIYCDEAAHIKNFDEFWMGLLPTISSGKKSQVILTSTPNGMNRFYRIWKEAESEVNAFKPLFVPWYEHPDRDEAWAEEQIKNTSQEEFDQEYGCKFIGSTATLLSSRKLESLTPVREAFHDTDTKIYDKPEQGHSYILSVDVAEGTMQDYSVVSVIDITYNKDNSERYPFKQVAVYRSNRVHPESLASVIYSIGKTYNDAFVIIENNSIGNITARSLYYDMEYENIYTSTSKYGETGVQEGITRLNIGIKQNKRTKAIGCAKLKSLMESDTLDVVDNDCIDEFLSFIKEGESYKAEDGHHDDVVMTLVTFAWLTSTDTFKEILGLSKGTIKASDSLLSRDSVPFGLFSSSTGDMNSGLSARMASLNKVTTAVVNGFEIPHIQNSTALFSDMLYKDGRFVPVPENMKEEIY